MKYNNVINTFRTWCSDVVENLYKTSKGNIPSDFICELHDISYILGMMTDSDFFSIDELKEQIMCIVNNKEIPRISEERIYYIKKARNDFIHYMNSVSDVKSVEIFPYERIVYGQEGEEISECLLRYFDYDCEEYWYPLTERNFDGEVICYDAELIMQYMPRISGHLGLPERHVFTFGEAWSERYSYHCAEVDIIENYSGTEAVYFDKTYSWLIYFSHENTVAFAGNIVHEIKNILPVI